MKVVYKFLKKLDQEKHNINFEKLLDHYGVDLTSNNLVNAISFKDPYVGDTITLITSAVPDIALMNTSYFTDFTLNSSILGVGITWINENFKTAFSNNGVEVYSINNAIFVDNTNAKNSTNLDFSKTTLPSVQPAPNSPSKLSRATRNACATMSRIRASGWTRLRPCSTPLLKCMR